MKKKHVFSSCTFWLLWPVACWQAAEAATEAAALQRVMQKMKLFTLKWIQVGNGMPEGL